MKASHDLDPLIRFVKQDDLWHGRLAVVLDEHILPPMEEFEIEVEDFADRLAIDFESRQWAPQTG